MDSSTPRQRLMGAAMLIAPVLLLASTIAHVAGSGLGEDQTGGVIQVYAFAAFFVVLIGLTGMLEGVAPRAAAALTVTGALGLAAGAGYGINSIYAALGTIDINDNVENAAGPLALQMPGILFPLTFIALGVLLMRARVEPRWSPPLLIAAAIAFPLSRIPSVEPLALVADSLFLLALVPLGLEQLRGRAPRAAPAASRAQAG